MGDYFAAFDEPSGPRSVVIEDDGRSVYAYLVRDEEIISDVWLANSAPDDDVRWDDPAKLPFPNKPENIDRNVQLAFDETTLIRLAWDVRGVDVFVDDALAARLEEGAMPAWSRGALVDSPVALRLTSRRYS